MAIFGGIGKRLGLGTAESLVTRVTGSPLAGAIAGEVSEGISGLGRSVTSNIGQGTAKSQAGSPPAETARSGERGPVNGSTTLNLGISGGGIVPASYGMNVPSAAGMGSIQPTGLPAIIQGGRAVVSSVPGMLGLSLIHI